MSGHISKISGVVKKYSSDKVDIIRAEKTSLPGITNGNASFDDSQNALIELADLSQQLINNIEKQQASNSNSRS